MIGETIAHAEGAAGELKAALVAIGEGRYLTAEIPQDETGAVIGGVARSLAGKARRDLSRLVDLSIEANETGIFSAELLHNLRKVDERAQSIAASATEMVASVDSIKGYSDSISKEASIAEETVAAGSAAVRDAVARMEEIAAAVKQTVEEVNGLASLVGRIAAISADIGTIAQQTNYLALNASIEASRAGPAGKGFAVIASEVRSLAGRAASYVNDIDDLASQLQSGMESTVRAMNGASETVVGGQEAIGSVEQRTGAISEQFAAVRAETDNIVATLVEQGQASKSVASGIETLADSCASSVDGVERIVACMDRLTVLVTGQLAEFDGIEVPSKVILLAKSDHVLWKKRLANMMAGREGLRADELANHHSCRLGKWYDKVDDPALMNDPNFRMLQEPHRLVHDHGIQAVRYCNAGDTQGALQEIRKVEDASAEVLRLLSLLDEAAARREAGAFVPLKRAS